jgi:glutamate/aspartate transport system substrate-binding protein
MGKVRPSSKRLAVIIALLVILFGCGDEAFAQTLEKVRNSGTITIGYFDSQVPLSYVGPDKKPIGYQIEICQVIAGRIKASLGLSDLDIRYVSVSEASSVPQLANGTVDLVCGGRAHTEDREQYAAFTYTTFVNRFTILSRKENAYQTISDLKSKKIVFSAGTIVSKRITDLDFRGRLGMTLIPAKNQVEAFKIFESGQADAYVSTETTIAGLIARSKNGSDYTIARTPLWIVPFAVMIRKNDPQLKQLADASIADLFRGRQIVEIHQRWFAGPIPPDNIILHIPISQELNKLFARPSDSPRAADYE